MTPGLRAPRPGGGLFLALMGALLAVLIAALTAVAALAPPWSWLVGFVYLAYDTWLLSLMVRLSTAAVRAESARGPEARGGPSLAVIICARDERAVLPDALEAVLAQDDQPDELLVVDDGSTDGTRAMLEERFGLVFEPGAAALLGRSSRVPSLRALSRPNAGKARSLNDALALAQSEVLVTLDADTRLDPGALGAMRAAFQDPGLAAACGVLRPSSASPAFELYQAFEYLRSFLWRLAWMRDGTLVLVSGAFAAFRATRLRAVGGFDPGCRVEDYEVMFRLHRESWERLGAPLRVRVVSAARAVTDVPARPGLFLRQRARWFAGFLETLVKNHDLVGNRAYGRLGRFHLVVKTIDALLPVYGLSASVSLVVLLVSHRGLDRLVLAVLVLKFAFDFSCHSYCLFLHQRWQGARVTGRLFARAALASLTEPYFFQFLRQLGALFGWVAFLRGHIEWTPQRPRPAGPALPPGA